MGEKNEFDFEGDAAVNPNDLDGEWLRQAALYGHWASRYADELLVKDRIWLRKKVIKAQLFEKAKKLLVDSSGKPPTDGRCDAYVHAQPEYEEISLRLIEAEFRVNKCDGAKWTFEQKKKSLEELSRTRDRAMGMPDNYSPAERREEIIKKRNEESERLDKEFRGRIKR